MINPGNSALNDAESYNPFEKQPEPKPLLKHSFHVINPETLTRFDLHPGTSRKQAEEIGKFFKTGYHEKVTAHGAEDKF